MSGTAAADSRRKVRTAVEEEGSRGETETRRRKEESGRRRDGRKLEESVLELRGRVSGEGPRRRPGRPGFQRRRAELLSSTHGVSAAAVEVKGDLVGVRKF